ncbi:hypothetical protein IT403_02545 [Candidatus Nomurabacteria bacterium]|nr:hypothetical protein [Candidatus Nomurabacteria bacterium]
MEKGPVIRTIGNASSEKKEMSKKEIINALFNHFESLSPQEEEELRKHEYPKSEKEISVINFANQETSRLMKEAGIEPYDIPTENFHIIPSDLYKKAGGDNSIARAFTNKQGILFDAQEFRDNPLHFGSTAIHESLHLKAHLSLEVQEKGEKIRKTPYREGVTIKALQGHDFHRHFAGLHETIVAETQKRLLPKLLDCPALITQKEWLLSDEAKKIKNELIEKRKIPESDIIWVGKKGDDDWESIQYTQQRKVLNYVCDEIKKQFPNEYKNIDDVYKVFLNAHFTGRLLDIAKIVEKTFGEGSFRILGNMETDRESGVLHLESLKKARGRQKKGNFS